jgi:enamine deaminase RidA (YjgF/YER057c/UK114 family)
MVWTAGTVAADEEGVVHGADSYGQCCYIFEKLARALEASGCALKDTVKVTCYITGAEHADGFIRAHKQFLGDVEPVCTCVIVAGLFGGALAEIELTCLIP